MIVLLFLYYKCTTTTWLEILCSNNLDKHILIRAIGLSALGKLDKTTIRLASQLEAPHHEGAGRIEDFDDKESFQKHVKRVSNRKKRKRLENKN